MSRLQQVNLYSDELKTQKLNYSSLTVMQLSVFIVVVLSVAAGFRTYQLKQQQSAFEVKQAAHKIAMADLKTLQSELSKRKKDTKLKKQVTEKTKELANKQKVLGILSQDEFGNTDGFIEHISGLARQRINGLWLTKVRIASGGTDIALRGTTSKPALLPKYLQRLSAEKVFVGTEFQSLLMSRQEKKTQWLNFSLQNKKIAEVNP